MTSIKRLEPRAGNLYRVFVFCAHRTHIPLAVCASERKEYNAIFRFHSQIVTSLSLLLIVVLVLLRSTSFCGEFT